MKQIQKGFTLIELMIVVAIIGILAAIAIPSYAKYTARAQGATGLAAIAALKTPIDDWYNNNNTAPTLASLGSSSAASPIGTIAGTILASTTGAGTLTFTFTNASPKVKGALLTQTRTVDGIWSCTKAAGTATAYDATVFPAACS